MDQSAIETYLARVRAAGTADLPACALVTPEFQPIPPHLSGIAHLILRPRLVLADPTGTGKTPQTLVAFAYLKAKSPNLKMLVQTTQAAQFQWVKAAEKFLVGMRAEVLSYGRVSRQPARWEQLGPVGRATQLQELTQADIVITTYALAAKEEQAILQLMSGQQFIYVLDEAHTLKGHRGAVMYPAATRIRDAARGTWGLTATPMMNDRLDELYALMELVRPGTFGSYTEFRKTYFDLQLIKPKWKGKNGKQARPFYKVLGYRNLPLLRSQIDPFLLMRPSATFDIHLPALVFQQLDIQMESKQTRLYEDIKAKHFPGAKTPLAQLAALTYAQIAVDAPSVLGFPDIPNAKLKTLVDLLGDNYADQKVIVYTKFEKVLETVSAALTAAGLRHERISGSVSAMAREKARTTFQDDPNARIILITNAGAQALDLQAARVVIAYDLPWSWGEFQQVIGRARRFGSQSSSIVCLLLTTKNTIDATVSERLTEKETVIRNVLRKGFTETDTLLSSKTVLDPKQELSQEMCSTDEVSIPSSDLQDLFTAVRQ